MPFRTRAGQPRDLLALVDGEVRERIEDAVDHVVLEIMVETRRRHRQPAPAADNARDRAEFEAGVQTFLARLGTELEPALEAQRRDRVQAAVARAGRDPTGGRLALQVELAKALPDYWQRFDAVRQAWAAEQLRSSGERRGLLGRFLSR
jgi:hypothetical protein